jgi:hypothetical protein
VSQPATRAEDLRSPDAPVTWSVTSAIIRTPVAPTG